MIPLFFRLYSVIKYSCHTTTLINFLVLKCAWGSCWAVSAAMLCSSCVASTGRTWMWYVLSVASSLGPPHKHIWLSCHHHIKTGPSQELSRLRTVPTALLWTTEKSQATYCSFQFHLWFPFKTGLTFSWHGIYLLWQKGMMPIGEALLRNNA